MSTMAIVAASLFGLVAAFIGLQVFMVRRMVRKQGQPPPTLDGKAGRRIERGKPALFYFFSPQCGACRAMTPVVKSMASHDDGVFPVDISQDMATARKFGVMATPTTIVVRDGVIARVLVGPQPETTLRGLMSPA